MNIIITLPQELIAEILNGHKTIELRKICPVRYNINFDWVYVVTEGKTTVQLAFQVSSVVQTCFFGEVWHVYHKRLCMQYDSFMKYIKGEPFVFLWHIGQIAYAKKPIPLSDIKSNARAPRFFVYCNTPFEELPFTIMSNPHTRK